ncbi:uncharacterized protein LOC131050708 isoform X2 [Cryptomeria japonica]|uniref:uncharacterized protein LOC131050708 isoform X2 n=1 Tax=Cryptomeria japonica TaxID=3369 RepID=UPI0027DAACCB|nr:uncharacterized protein LOC131050708 isoform X2 [Cryptomeria japonica]
MASRLHCLTRAAFGPCTSPSKASKCEKNKKHKKSTSLKNGIHHVHEDTHRVDKDTQNVNNDAQNQQDGRNNAGSHGEGEIPENILKIKKQLRPLLDAIISVESDKMNRIEGCKGGTRIGMLQINEQYHRDAWGPNASSYQWSQCRDTEYAENTVVVFWLRHCPDAVINNDWETLARIHHGGPEGLGTNSANHYWTEICRWMEHNFFQAPSVSEPYKNSILHTTVPMQGMTTSAERQTLADISNLHVSNKDVTSTQKRQNGRQVWHMKKNNKQGSKDDIKELCTTILQPVQHISSNLKGKGTKYSCPTSRSQFSLTNAPFIIEGTKSNSVINKRRNSLDFCSSNNLLKVWKPSRSIQREKAAIIVQAYCRMFLIKTHYKRMKSAVLKIQRWWRQYGSKGMLSGNYSTVQSMETVLHEQFLYHRNQPPIVLSRIQDENEALPSNVELLQSPADLLYKGNISAAEEEKVLTELANLLSPSNNNGLEQFNCFESDIVDEELGNFHFPYVQDGESEKSTPVLTRIHSPRLRGTCISHEKNSSGDMENVMPEWLELKKSDFMEMDGGNTNFMPIKADETVPDFVNIISERKQLYDTAIGSVAASANCTHFSNCSDYWKQYCSKKINPGSGNSQFKTFCLDESPNASIYDGTNEENTGEFGPDI